LGREVAGLGKLAALAQASFKDAGQEFKKF
jgi:hypothetical protein